MCCIQNYQSSTKMNNVNRKLGDSVTILQANPELGTALLITAGMQKLAHMLMRKRFAIFPSMGSSVERETGHI